MKKAIILALCLSAALMLAGCTTNADPIPSPAMDMNSPSVSPLTSPGMNMGTGSPNATSLPDAAQDLLTGTVARITNTNDALTASQQVRDAVAKLSEVDTAVCVVADDKAVIGITYDSTYRGKTDDRMRGMVYARAKAINPAITTIYVTDDPAVSNEIASLYQMLQTGSPYSTIQNNLKTLTANLDPYKE